MSACREDARAPEPSPGSSAGRIGTLAAEAVHALVAVLEHDAALAQRLRDALLLPQAATTCHNLPRFMTVAEYALHARLGVRTIRSYVAMMTEGVQYNRDGIKGRRITINVEAADAWRVARGNKLAEAQSVEELANNEVLRRRARAALRKVYAP